MTIFSDQNRDKPMWHTVSFHDVPMFRALALALDHAQDHGSKFAIFAADRRQDVVDKFNKEHGTNLHGQQYLYDHQHDVGFNPADKPGTSSHTLASDGNPAYQVNGHLIPFGQPIPNYMLGIDAADAGSQTDCTQLVGKLHFLGYHVVRPYHSGSEAHHLSFVTNPIHTLKAHNRVPNDTPESDK